MYTTIDDQLIKYLTDAHAIEEQALVQLKAAPRVAHDRELAAIFRQHLAETEDHERLVRGRLESRGAKPSVVKELVMKAGGVGFLLFARAQPDTPGKLIAHAYSFEHLELASYELLRRVAERAGDTETVSVAERIAGQEQAMARRLEQSFERAAEASLQAKDAAATRDELLKYLADAHALEAQAVGLLKKATKLVDDPELERMHLDHLAETYGQQRLIEERLRALGGSPSRLKDAALRLGSLNWGMFLQAHPDTSGKLAAFAFAFEHLEIAGYELLARVARRAGDDQTVGLAERIAAEERAAAERIASSWDRAADAALREQGVAVAG